MGSTVSLSTPEAYTPFYSIQSRAEPGLTADCRIDVVNGD